MRTMTYSKSRAKYAETLNAVTDDREEVIITRAGHDPAVMVSLEDYESLKETAYLLRSPENARRLLASIERLETGTGSSRDLIELLKHGFQGYWSRRTTDEHRLIYKLMHDEIQIAACRYHYSR